MGEGVPGAHVPAFIAHGEVEGEFFDVGGEDGCAGAVAEGG